MRRDVAPAAAPGVRMQCMHQAMRDAPESAAAQRAVERRAVACEQREQAGQVVAGPVAVEPALGEADVARVHDAVECAPVAHRERGARAARTEVEYGAVGQRYLQASMGEALQGSQDGARGERNAGADQGGCIHRVTSSSGSAGLE